MNRPMKTLTTAATVLLAVTLIVGCQKSDPVADPTPIPEPSTTTPTPTPSTTPTPTPTPSVTPTPTQQQLFTQAVAQYTRTENEVLRVWKLGGLKPNEAPTPELIATTTGTPLEEYTTALRNLHDKQIVNISGKRVIHGAKIAPTAKGALITINVCIDDSRMVNEVGPSKTKSHGFAGRTIASYKMVDGQLKLFSGTSERDDTCIAK